jgi:hypothetical protein
MMMQGESAAGGHWKGAVGDEDLHSEQGRTTIRDNMGVDKHVPMAHYGEQGSDMLNYMRLTTVNNYFMRKYARFMQGMKTKGIFDNSLAVCAYSFRDGNHKGGACDAPVLVSGKGGGFKTGFHHRMISLAPELTKGFNPSTDARSKLLTIHGFWKTVLSKYGVTYNANAKGDFSGLFG